MSGEKKTVPEHKDLLLATPLTLIPDKAHLEMKMSSCRKELNEENVQASNASLGLFYLFSDARQFQQEREARLGFELLTKKNALSGATKEALPFGLLVPGFQLEDKTT